MKDNVSILNQPGLKEFALFNDMVSNSYLTSLMQCEVKKPEHLPDTFVRWYRITKIVIEKDVFFADKLSMLYMSLHHTARNVILVVNKEKENGNIELYLGARDFHGRDYNSAEILKAGLEGYLPGVGLEKVKGELKLPEYKNYYLSSVSAVASLRDEKKENFVQGIERLINASTSIPMFTAYFIAENVSREETSSMISAFSDLHTQLAPLAECQISTNESHTSGSSESISESVTRTISTNISKTVTKSENFSKNIAENDGVTENHTTNYSPGILTSIWSSIFGGESGSSGSYAHVKGTSKQTGTNKGTAVGKQTESSDAKSDTKETEKSTNKSDTIGTSKQITYKNFYIQKYLELIENQVERIENGIPFGMWSVATYFIAPASTTSIKLANLYRGCIIGEESNLGTCAINSWSKEGNTQKLLTYIGACTHPRFNYNGIDVSAGTVVTSKELAIHLSLPQSSVPGLLVREEHPFGRNVISNENNNIENRIEIGNIMSLGNEYSDNHVFLDCDSLTKHTFITGTTGSGKSNTMYLLLQDLFQKGKKILVIEPAKGEYKNVFGGLTYKSDNGEEKQVKVYGSNPNFTHLLRINPFEFSDQIHVFEHIDRLVEIFNACWPMYAAMPVVLKKAITDAYKNCGWDLDTSSINVPYGIKLFPTIKDVVSALQDYINNSEYSEQTKGDYKGSIETRLLSLSEGLTGSMLNNSTNNLTDKELFEENVIVDLSKVNNSETKSLIMGLIIMKLSEYYQSFGEMNSHLNHVTVLEEAHNILKRTSTNQSQEGSNLTGKSVEMISNSIAEMRTYGEGFIIVDQSPSQVDMAAIRNTNTKIIMALPEADDRECAGKSIGLSDKQIEEIGRQKVGQGIVYQNGWEEAVQCKIKFASINETSFAPQKDELLNATEKTNNETIIRFLFSCCNESVGFSEFELTKQNILNSKYSSSLKNNLLRVLHNYQSGELKMDERNRAKLLELTGACLGEFGNIQKILSVKKNVSEINTAVNNLIQDVFGFNDPLIIRFCTRGMFRLQASKSSKVVPLYNEWLKTFYKL
mgnify:FL=1